MTVGSGAITPPSGVSDEGMSQALGSQLAELCSKLKCLFFFLTTFSSGVLLLFFFHLGALLIYTFFKFFFFYYHSGFLDINERHDHSRTW